MSKRDTPGVATGMLGLISMKLAGSGEKSKVLADGAQLNPLIMWPHNVLETCSFLCVVGDMSGHTIQDTVLLGYGYPGKGELANSKVEVLGGQSHLGNPPSQAPHTPPNQPPA